MVRSVYKSKILVFWDMTSCRLVYMCSNIFGHCSIFGLSWRWCQRTHSKRW